jgi:predicted nucleotidyltransferase
MKPDLEQALFAAVDALEALDLPWALVGGMAMNTWVKPRATKDVDVYADLPARLRPRLQRELEQRGFHVPAMEEELQRFGVFRSRSADGVFLDVFEAVGPLGQAILDRRRKVVVEGHDLRVCTPEDLAVLKVFSDRERDLDDVVALAAAPKLNLDLSYVERWARQLDDSQGVDEVTTRLRRAITLAEARARRR